MWQYAAFAVGGMVALKWAMNAFNTADGSDLVSQGQSQGEKPSHQDYKYKQFADAIYNSTSGIFSSSDKVVEIFEKDIKNLVDLGLLKKAFGERNYGFDIIGMKNMLDLDSVISTKLGSSFWGTPIKNKVNEALAKNKINYSFQ